MQSNPLTVLVTGAAGYIGSHTAVELLDAGHAVVSIDNYANSAPAALQRVERITGRGVVAIDGDLRDGPLLQRVFESQRIDAVIHFAALKAVGDSVRAPLEYYDNNVVGTIRLLQAMRAAGVRRLVFSSSATVYGVPTALPLTEDAPLSAVNPYGATKVVVENLLRDLCGADPSLSVVALRYFNPIGAHASGLIGEDPRGVPNNLFPFITQVAVGRRDHLTVFGDDWPTADGTGVRDYIHVVDLARGHLSALEYTARQHGFAPINLGTGHGTSVLTLVAAFERATGRAVPRRVAARRAGDIAACWADVSRAASWLGWHAALGLDDMCRDGWRWQQANPDGYRGATPPAAPVAPVA